MTIKENVHKILAGLPEGVQLVAAAKGRSPEEIMEAVEVGVSIIGQNYVQEAERAYPLIGQKAKWHFIGHLQKNKVKKAVSLFDMIETVDSIEIAEEIDKRCRQLDKTMPVLVEVNSGGEAQKTGISPKGAEELTAEISVLKNIKLMGLMTVGPLSDNPEDSRPYFAETKMLFEWIKNLSLPNVEMRYLSMGMSASYKVAIEEGANIVRLGTIIFGARP